MLWVEELEAIEHQADDYGVDYIWIATIRKVEWGPPGLEFGVETEINKGYDAQLRATCATVRDRLMNYGANPYKTYGTGAMHLRLGYNEKFIRWFAGIWAPVGVDNDPKGLNRYWPLNALEVYPRLMQELVRGYGRT